MGGRRIRATRSGGEEARRRLERPGTGREPALKTAVDEEGVEGGAEVGASGVARGARKAEEDVERRREMVITGARETVGAA